MQLECNVYFGLYYTPGCCMLCRCDKCEAVSSFITDKDYVDDGYKCVLKLDADVTYVGCEHDAVVACSYCAAHSKENAKPRVEQCAALDHANKLSAARLLIIANTLLEADTQLEANKLLEAKQRLEADKLEGALQAVNQNKSGVQASVPCSVPLTSEQAKPGDQTHSEQAKPSARTTALQACADLVKETDEAPVVKRPVYYPYVRVRRRVQNQGFNKPHAVQ